jgi:hypothetical protein
MTLIRGAVAEIDQFDPYREQGGLPCVGDFDPEVLAVIEQCRMVAQILPGEYDRLDAGMLGAGKLGTLDIGVVNVIRQIEMKQGHGIRSAVAKGLR